MSPNFPDGYWPRTPGPETPKHWDDSVRAFQSELAEFQSMVKDGSRDLYQVFPWGDGQTLLREAMLLADHNAYHLGQLVLVRRLLGSWE